MTTIRRGFTLLEMLIAITLLGMLSAIFMFSTLDATAAADASNIINNMNHIRTAVLMWYKQNSSRIIPSGNEYMIETNGNKQYFSEFVRDHGSEILKYLDNRKSIAALRYKKAPKNNTGDYSLIAVKKTKQWYVCCKLGTTNTNSDMEAVNMKIKKKLAGSAKTLGLLGVDNLEVDEIITDAYKGQIFVCMPILELSK